MAVAPQHPLAMDGSDPTNLRGDPMDGQRYYSREFAQKEWDGLWTRIWHIAGRVSELQEPGDYVVHDFLYESVFCVMQDDGSIRAFYNTCQHRGQRLVWGASHAREFHCPYHGWVWARDGLLTGLPDPEDFRRGNPCGKLRLKELRCEQWGGFIWYTMSDQAPSLLDYLEPMPEVYKNYPLDQGVRCSWRRIELETNWKFFSENFSESYHTRTAHPQIPAIIDQDHWTSRQEMWPRGHSRIVQPGRPSLRDRLPDGVPHPFDGMLRRWGLDPDAYPDFETKVLQGWQDLKREKRAKGIAAGRTYYADLTDEELTDSPHTVFFPNVTMSFHSDHFTMWRTEPHRENPNKCSFDIWQMFFPAPGLTEVDTSSGRRPFEEALFEHFVFDRGRGVPDMTGEVGFQDMSLSEGQQLGQHSRGYADAYLADQESRVRRWNEVLNDYLEGRR